MTREAELCHVPHCPGRLLRRRAMDAAGTRAGQARRPRPQTGAGRHRQGCQPFYGADARRGSGGEGSEDSMRYEIEQAGLGHKPGPDVGTHAEPERWHVVNILDTEVVPTPLTFDTVDQALAYVARMPGTLRVVEVSDEGERVPVGVIAR